MKYTSHWCSLIETHVYSKKNYSEGRRIWCGWSSDKSGGVSLGIKTSRQDIVMASAGGYRNIQIGREVWDPRQRYVYTFLVAIYYMNWYMYLYT